MSRVIIDVREPQEYARDHAEGAINIPPYEIMAGSDKLNNLDKDTEIILYCVSGSRSNVCAHILQQQGFTNITNGINKQQVSSKFV